LFLFVDVLLPVVLTVVLPVLIAAFLFVTVDFTTGRGTAAIIAGFGGCGGGGGGGGVGNNT
jgi:hypothetical protein